MNKIARNVFFSMVGIAWPSVLLLIATPVIINGLGSAAFGVWSLIGNIVGYMALFNSLQTAGTKYLSEFLVSGDRDKIRKLLGTSLVFNLSVGAVGCGTIFLTARFLATSFFDIPSDLQNQSIIAFRLAGVGFFLTTIGWWAASIQSGIQRYDWLTGVSIIMTTFFTVGSVAAIWMGWGIVGVVAANVLGALLAAIVNVWSIPRLLPGIKLRLDCDWVTFRLIFYYGIFSTLHMILGLLSSQLDRTLLGVWIGAAAVAIYSVPLSIATRIHQLCARSLSVVFPVSSSLDAERRGDHLRRLFLRAQNFNNFLIIMISVPLVVLSREILGLWINQEFANEAVLVFRLLIVAYGLLASNVVVSAMAAGLGHPEINAAFAFFLGLTNLAGYLIFIPKWGVNGAGVASALASVVSVPFLIYYINRRFINLPMSEIIRFTILRPFLSGALIYILLTIVRPWISNLGILIASLMISSCAYLIISIPIGVWEKQELELVHNGWGYIFAKLRP